jgi:hypothetical protein
MTGPRTLAWISLLVCIAALSVNPIENNDIFIHLKTGEYVLQHGSVPVHDPYSFTASDRDYVAHEWLAGVLFHLVHRAFGIAGLILFKTAIVAAAYALLLAATARAGASLPVALCALVPVLFLSSARWVERPHVFSYLLTALYLWLFFRYREDRDPRWLYLVVPADVLWTNLHGGFVAGLALLVVLAMGETALHVRDRRVDEPILPRHLAILILLVPACIAASLLNPYGARALTFPFELTSLAVFMQRVYEWQPPYHQSYNGSTMFVVFVAYLGALLGAFFLRYRQRRIDALFVVAAATLVVVLLALRFGGSPETYRPAIVAGLLYALLALFCIFTILHLRRVDLTLAGLVVFFLLLSFRHNRAVTDAALGTFPVLAVCLTSLLGRGSRLEKRALLAGSAALLLVAGAVSIGGYPYDFAGSKKRIGLGIAPGLPTCAVEFMAREHLSGNAFVSYSDGAMVIGRLYPEVRVNIDSRNDVYGEERYREYLDSLGSADAMDAYLARHAVDFFLLPYEFRVPEVFDALERSGTWAPVSSSHRRPMRE